MGVFIRQFTGMTFIGTNDDLRDRLDRRGAPRLNVDEGVAIFEADGWHYAQCVRITHRQVIRNARLVRDVGVDCIGANRGKWRPYLTGGVDEGSPPLRLSGEARVGAGYAPQKTLRWRASERIG
jgi:hypothetical protein